MVAPSIGSNIHGGSYIYRAVRSPTQRHKPGSDTIWDRMRTTAPYEKQERIAISHLTDCNSQHHVYQHDAFKNHSRSSNRGGDTDNRPLDGSLAFTRLNKEQISRAGLMLNMEFHKDSFANPQIGE
ncbi:hypothetical protein CDV31_011786 [Fusarium ambrosium]|uniref:Uncharacterized protein n=1 Tax=Fusarium ambrosium TaxID=131363 RepID=A0A428TEK1_9HYPO|nr:hypothetical protein CDV31_011786 [Fusarium ambrosium]